MVGVLRTQLRTQLLTASNCETRLVFHRRLAVTPCAYGAVALGGRQTLYCARSYTEIVSASRGKSVIAWVIWMGVILFAMVLLLNLELFPVRPAY